MDAVDDALLEARARRRVALRTGFWLHALVYALVNGGLWLAGAFAGGPRATFVPLLGWGLGLLIHGAAVAFALHGEGLRERMVRREVEALRRRGG